MTVGHGSVGLRSNIPSYFQVAGPTAGRGYPLVDAALGKEIQRGSWELVSGTQYRTRVNYVIGGILRDVVGVDVSRADGSLAELTRVSTLGQMGSDTFYADSWGAKVPQEFWDQNGPPPGFDSWGTYFDQFPPLWLYVDFSGNPNNRTVVANLAFRYSARAVRHPVLGPNLLTNGGLDASDDGFYPDAWTDVVSGISLDDAHIVDTNEPRVTPLGGAFKGPRALQFYAVPTNYGGQYRFEYQQAQPTSWTVGQRLRFSGAYRTEKYWLWDGAEGQDALAPLIIVRLSSGSWTSGTRYEMNADGRTYATLGGGETEIGPTRLLLERTNGLWRRFVFEFLFPDVASNKVFFAFGAYMREGYQGIYSRVFFDDLKLSPVLRYEDYEERLSDSSIPELEMGVSDVHLAHPHAGLGGVSLVNGRGPRSLYAQFGDLILSRRRVSVLAGGVVGGVDLVREDCRGQFTGFTDSVEASDNEVRFGLSDAQSELLDTKLPRRLLNFTDTPNAPINDMKKPRQLLVGAYTGTFDTFVPQRVDADASTGYGVYEYCDTYLAPNGTATPGVTSVLVYQTADERDGETGVARALTGGGVDYSVDTAGGRFTILKDVIDIWREATGKDFGGAFLDFDIGGANIAAGVYGGAASWPEKVASDLAAQMTSLAGVTINVTYSNTTHKFTFSRPLSATLNLRVATGPNSDKARRHWTALGFNGDADKTSAGGGGSCVSDNSIFTSADLREFLRIRAYGLRDDAGGTYTGVANDVITRIPSVCHMLLRSVGRVPLARINTASFNATTLSDYLYPGSLTYSMARRFARLRLTERVTLRTLIAQVAGAGLSHVFADGEGVWHFRPGLDAYVFLHQDEYPNTMSLPEPRVVTDDDVLPGTWVTYQRRDGIFARVEVEDADDDVVSATWDPDVYARTGRDAELRVKAPLYLSSALGATSETVEDARRLALILAKWSSAARFACRFAVRAILSDQMPGDRLWLTRSGALRAGGAVERLLVRIVGVRHNYMTNVSHVVAVEDVPMGPMGGQQP